MIYTPLGIFCLFFNWESANIQPQIRLRKIPVAAEDILKFCCFQKQKQTRLDISHVA